MAEEQGGFLSRWSRRKTALVQGIPLQEASIKPAGFVDEAAASSPKPADAADAANAASLQPAVASNPNQQSDAEISKDLPQLSLEDTKFLTKDSDFTPFMAQNVSASVRNAAMKKLFADPHFNVMDGLDTYIDDYSKFVPLPESVLRQMNGAQFLNLFSEEAKADEGGGDEHATPSATQHAGHQSLSETGEASALMGDAVTPEGAGSGENLNNLTDQTVAQSYAQENIAAVAAVQPTISSQPGLTNNPEASQQDHAHTDLRLQPDDAAPAPDAGRSAQ